MSAEQVAEPVDLDVSQLAGEAAEDWRDWIGQCLLFLDMPHGTPLPFASVLNAPLLLPHPASIPQVIEGYLHEPADRSTPTDLADLANLLYVTRRDRGLSQRATAAQIGVAPSVVHNIERGRDCRLSTAVAVLGWVRRG